jgi:hypothetical protein
MAKLERRMPLFQNSVPGFLASWASGLLAFCIAYFSKIFVTSLSWVRARNR